LIAVIVCQLTLYLVPDQPQTVSLFWTIIHILFSFFVLGVRFGVTFTFIHAISFTYFNLFYLQASLHSLSDINSAQVYSAALYIFLSFGLIAFLGWQNYHSGEFAKKLLLKAKMEMQEQYDVISKQSEEKTVMLKEIHHRVKNNLQIITSLLRLQSRELESPEAIAKFKDATHRVIAMSMIHEKMYQNDALSSMHLREYLHDLSKDLISSYQSDYEVKLHIECDVETVGLRSVVPLALILNELISNSLKYAFDDEKNCLISISFMYLSGKNCKLIYKDSGTWKPPSRKGSFGLDLIESLTYQLEGSLRTETHPETIFEFIIAPEIDENPSRFDSANV
jgi:two-component system, sensor histidine kinase PdtaS